MRLDRFITLNLVQPFRQARSSVLGPRSSVLGPPSSVPILMYHSITEAPEPGVAPYYQVNTSPARFSEHMQLLADQGYRTVTLTQALELLRQHAPANSEEQQSNKELEKSETSLPSLPSVRKNGSDSVVSGPGSLVSSPSVNPSSVLRPPSSGGNGQSSVLRPPSAEVSGPLSVVSGPRRFVVLTFDDGFRNFYTDAFPILQQHGFLATVFLPTAFIGDERRQFAPAGNSRSSVLRPPSSALDCLTWSEVCELHEAGIEFGSHTVNHPKLVDLPWPEIERELRDSKSEIEARLQGSVLRPPSADDRPPSSVLRLPSTGLPFCYPFAFPQTNRPFVNRFTDLLRETGYTCCTTTRLGIAKPGDDPFALKRLPANSMDDPALFHAKLAGAYDWLATPQSAVKRLKSAVRRQ